MPVESFKGFHLPDPRLPVEWHAPRHLKEAERKQLEEEYKKKLLEIFKDPGKMNSGVLNDPNDPRAKIFFRAYEEDLIESKPKRRKADKLIAGEKIAAEKNARAMIKDEGKAIFVASRKAPMFDAKKRRIVMAEEPIGYISYRVTVTEGMASADLVLRCDRIYLSKKFHGLGASPFFVMRALGHAFISNPNLAFASFKDPWQYKTGHVLKSMQRKGMIEEIQARKDKGDIYVKLSQKALEREAKILKAFKKYRNAKGLRKALERARLSRERRKYHKTGWTAMQPKAKKTARVNRRK